MTPREIIANDAMVDAYKHAFNDFMAKFTAGMIHPKSADVGREATKYALEYALTSADYVHPPTVEKCAEVAARLRWDPANGQDGKNTDIIRRITRDWGTKIATAIRALTKEKQG